MTRPAVDNALPMRHIFQTWWPLGASWLLMGVELPALSAVVARLPTPEISLAAYGIVFSLSLIVEAPIIMLLAASTALSKDWDSYVKLRRFMTSAGALLTLVHVLVAFTPLYYVVVGKIIEAPPEIIGPARIGLMIMTPWTWSIAYRRFQQGVLIRFGHSRAVGIGTVVRLSSNALVLTIGYMVGNVPGIVVATSAVACGVVSEAIYAGLRVQAVLREQLRHAQTVTPPLTIRAFAEFYAPLVMTSLLTMLTQPIGSAALSRMPDALESLAIWPVLSGLAFLLRSPGMAYNEVVVALLDQPKSSINLRRFAGGLAVALTVLLLCVAATPLAQFWFLDVSALAPDLAGMASTALWFTIPMPALTVMQNWYQGSILHGRRTRGITEAIVISLLTSGGILLAGVVWGQVAGLYIGGIAFTTGALMQTLWLWWRSRPAMRAVRTRDEATDMTPQPSPAG